MNLIRTVLKGLPKRSSYLIQLFLNIPQFIFVNIGFLFHFIVITLITLLFIWKEEITFKLYKENVIELYKDFNYTFNKRNLF